MTTDDWTFSKPYDLRERLLEFACVTVRLVVYLRTQGSVARALSDQLLKAGTSAGANYEEADDGSSGRDRREKRRIALRELKESRFRLLVLRRSGFLTPEHDRVIQEATELIRIFATLIRNSQNSD
jgi:four helix bundle protein